MLFDELPHEWQTILKSFTQKIATIECQLISEGGYLPPFSQIFSALPAQPASARVIIVGQDPYPNPNYPHGLAFSSNAPKGKIPASLSNIFRELHNDVGGSPRTNPDLTDWKDQGVVLLNRSLTVRTGASNSHRLLGWEEVTHKIVSYLAEIGCIGVLWGKSAASLSNLFVSENAIVSPHPSPLSARTGFFGSEPFSKVNKRLLEQEYLPINWG
jgi:uracil-DNA glycosylase